MTKVRGNLAISLGSKPGANLSMSLGRNPAAIRRHHRRLWRLKTKNMPLGKPYPPFELSHPKDVSFSPIVKRLRRDFVAKVCGNLSTFDIIGVKFRCKSVNVIGTKSRGNPSIPSSALEARNQQFAVG
jgi:hypothetical protein